MPDPRSDDEPEVPPPPPRQPDPRLIGYIERGNAPATDNEAQGTTSSS